MLTHLPAEAPWRTRRREVAEQLAMAHGGVVHRRQLREVGISHHDVRTEVRAGRWRPLGRHTVLVFGIPLALRDAASGAAAATSGPQDPTARWWWAVWESGSGAVLDGVSALIASGLTGYQEEVIHVTCPRGARPNRLHQVRLRRVIHVEGLPGGGVPRTRPEVAVIRAAQWARTDRQAALILAMTVQQRLAQPDRILTIWQQQGRSVRRQFLDAVILDVCDGAQAMSELDFAALCRAHRVPPPSRQVVRTTSTGRIYLDTWWEEQGVAVEIEGAHHTAGLNAVDDALRQNEQMIDDRVMLRIPVLGLRLHPDRFMAQVANALTSPATSLRARRRLAP